MTNFIIALLFLIFCFVFSPPATCFSNKTDLLSLLAFKSSVKDPHGSLNSWNQTTNFCTWMGIRCGRRHPDRVVGINLRSQGLGGSLSPHLGNLSFLTTIILQNNSFQGQIPQEIGFLRRLEYVEFSNNSFVGPIPRNLSGCPNLVYLNLIDNNLSGTIPIELGSLNKLEALGLARNNFPGPIPPFIGNITSLTRLSLVSCGLTGEIPESLARLQSLRFLQLSNNSLTGSIHSGLFNMSAIEDFVVYQNQLHGVIPSTIGLTLPNLRGLYLWNNQFSGPIPASISNASLLEQIILFRNNFTGPVPRVGRLTHLQGFLLGSNVIEDDIIFISSLTNSTELEYFEVGDNLLTGSLPDSIANLSTHLSSFYIYQNEIHGNIPSGIGNLISLNFVLLSYNYLEGRIPVDMLKLSNLNTLFMGPNRFMYELPSDFGNLTSLTRLYLNENNFSGNIPSSLGKCTRLLELDLSHNNFNGLIPPEIMSLSSISIIFNLSYNIFVGSIPYQVGSLTNLGILDLSNNKLSGPIPNSISNCIILQKLYLGGNLFEGEIPSGLSALMGLQDLDLSRNNLSGPIPNFLGKLNLEHLNLSFNGLQGEVPTTGVFRSKNNISVDGNRDLCGGIGELKLPSCSSVKSKKKNLSTLLKVLIPVLVAGGISLTLAVYFIKFKQKIFRGNLASSVPSTIGIQFMRLSYTDLLRATGGFSEMNLLGVGKFGSVYKGILSDGTQIAVKVLNLFVRAASKSFIAECNALRHVRHRNLVKILSVCESIDLQRDNFKALVYELKANGSLENWLYNNKEEEKGSEDTMNLSMIQRLNIAIDIAQGLEYLHCGTDSTIVHGDLKPSNILLDHEMTACVGDFGLAKIVSDMAPSHESNSSIGIRGTLGYVPPEYGTSHLVSTKGDVYSYGIVLLEMFTIKRPVDSLFKDHLNLHKFVDVALPDRTMEIVDPLFQTVPNMNNDLIKDCMTSILSIGVSCSKEMPNDRICMTDVVNELHKIRKLLSR